MKELPLWLISLNDSAALLLSLWANLALLYLIFRSTPDFLRPYAQILRIHCVMDVCCDWMLFLVGPQIYPLNHRLYYVNKGFWTAKSPAEFMYQLNLFNGFAVYLPTFMATIDFVFRWLLICRKYRMSYGQLGCYAAVVFLISMFCGYPYFSKITRTDPKLITKEEAEYFKRVLETDSVPRMAIAVTTEPLTFFIISVFNVVVAIEYGFIGYVVYRIAQVTARELKQNRENGKASTTNRHITRIMLLQAAIPMLTCGPVCVNTTVSMLGVDSPMTGAVCSLMLSWLAVFRPVATILIIPHYRRRILGRLGGGKSATSVGSASRL